MRAIPSQAKKGASRFSEITSAKEIREGTSDPIVNEIRAAKAAEAAAAKAEAAAQAAAEDAAASVPAKVPAKVKATAKDETLGAALKAMRAAKARPKKPGAMEGLREAAMRSYDDMMRVDAALDSFLTLLHLQGEINPDCTGLHALLLPVKDQLGVSAGQLNAHL